MNALITFFAAIGMIVVVTAFMSLILWIAVKIESHKLGIRKPKLPKSIERPEAPILGTQIKQSGNEPDYYRSFLDW